MIRPGPVRSTPFLAGLRGGKTSVGMLCCGLCEVRVEVTFGSSGSGGGGGHGGGGLRVGCRELNFVFVCAREAGGRQLEGFNGHRVQ